VVGSSVISHLPDEELAVLRKMEFQVLLDGDFAGARAGRDLFLGFLISGMIGLIGLLATTDWGEVFTKGKWGTAVWAAVMFAIVLASAVGAAIYAIRQHKVSQNSAYSSLISRLQKHFGINPK
jgi:heme exporter protein D